MTPMQLGVQAETEILRLAVTAGVFMGIIYDALKIVRRMFDKAAVDFLLDFLYAIMFGAVFFVFSLAQTDYVRGFVLFGMLFGAAAWSLTVGRLIVFLITGIFKIFDRLIFSRAVGSINKTAAKISGRFVKNSPNLENPKKITEIT
ncbi:MAG: spore cortex biosynthesis protein YabQ [Oscillospiraceae bacterium]